MDVAQGKPVALLNAISEWVNRGSCLGSIRIITLAQARVVGSMRFIFALE